MFYINLSQQTLTLQLIDKMNVYSLRKRQFTLSNYLDNNLLPLLSLCLKKKKKTKKQTVFNS